MRKQGWAGVFIRWNGIVEWNGGRVERPRPLIASVTTYTHYNYFKIQQSSLLMASKLCQQYYRRRAQSDPTERLEKCGSRLA